MTMKVPDMVPSVRQSSFPLMLSEYAKKKTSPIGPKRSIFGGLREKLLSLPPGRSVRRVVPVEVPSVSQISGPLTPSSITTVLLL